MIRTDIGQIEAIWIKRMRLGPMDAVDQAVMIAAQGLVGNANQRGRRQITLLDADVWEHITRQLEISLDPSVRRANIMVRGIDFANSRKQILRLGECRIRIFTEAKPCERMDEAWPGLQTALYPNWNGGACGEVLEGGNIRIGDRVNWDLMQA